MKYNPEFSPVKHLRFDTKEKLGKVLALVKLNPDDKEKPYFCGICGLRFLTESGASNHVDFKHTERIKKIIKETS